MTMRKYTTRKQLATRVCQSEVVPGVVSEAAALALSGEARVRAGCPSPPSPPASGKPGTALMVCDQPAYLFTSRSG